MASSGFTTGARARGGFGVAHASELEKGMATHFSVLAWRIPWTEEPGGLQSMGSQRIRHDWNHWASKWIYIYMKFHDYLQRPTNTENWPTGKPTAFTLREDGHLDRIKWGRPCLEQKLCAITVTVILIDICAQGWLLFLLPGEKLHSTRMV